MPLTQAERNWLEKAEEATNDPTVHGEGVSIRIVVYLLRQIVTLREQMTAINLNITTDDATAILRLTPSGTEFKEP
jgi:hypothetical protein